MELPLNGPTLIQVVGRVHRIGQTHEQWVYVLWANHTYDQSCLHRIARKFVASIAGEGSAAADDVDTTAAAEEKLRLFLGLKDSAYHPSWSDPKYTAKDDHIKVLERLADRAAAGISGLGDEDDLLSTQSPAKSSLSTWSKIGKAARGLALPATNLLRPDKNPNLESSSQAGDTGEDQTETKRGKLIDLSR